MKLSKYLSYLLKDFFAACGLLSVTAAIFLMIFSKEIVSVELFWQIILSALTFTLFKFAFINKYELEERAQMFSFFICSLLADTTLIILLAFFSPGRIINTELIIAYIFVILIIKAMVYAMIYSNSRTLSKQLNEKLIEYKSGKNN